MKTLHILLVPFVVFVLSACSSKEVYKPIQVVDDWKKSGGSDVLIQAVAQDVALVEERKVFVDGKVLDIVVAEDERVLSYSDGWVLSASIDGRVTLQHTQSKKVERLELKKTVATASMSGDTLAVLYADNEMALYSLASKTLLLKEQGNAPIVVNSKLVKPYFRDDLVIFATLDGKVVIINAQTKKRLRTIIVSSEEHFNNVIYFNLVDNKIIAATAHRILALSKEEARVAYDIRDVISDEKMLYVATKQGEIISLASDLKENAKLKFPFAHFLGLVASGEKLYALEKEGYVIEMPKDLSSFSVYEADVEDGYVHIHDKTFFIHDVYISVE